MLQEAKGINHIALRVSDLKRARHFYVDILGFQPVLENEGPVLVNGGGTLIGILGPSSETAASDRFNPFRVGLDHIALAITDAAVLETLKAALDAAGVSNNGVQVDNVTGATYISFFDPDGIAWELYAMRSA